MKLSVWTDASFERLSLAILAAMCTSNAEVGLHPAAAGVTKTSISMAKFSGLGWWFGTCQAWIFLGKHNKQRMVFQKMTRSNIQHPTGIQPHSSLFTNSSASRPRNFRNSWERFGLCSVPCLALVSYNSSGSSTHTCSEDLLTVHCAVRCAFGSQIRAFMNPAWTQHGHRTAFYESSMYPASIKLFLLFFDSHFAARGCGNDMTSFQLSFGNKMRWSIAGMTSV